MTSGSAERSLTWCRVPRRNAAQQTTGAIPSTINATGTVYAATSTDGGKTWGSRVEVVNNASGYAPGVRCCLFGADIDAVTHVMYVAYEGGGPGNTDPVMISSSRDGVNWFSPVPVSQGDVPASSGSTSM